MPLPHPPPADVGFGARHRAGARSPAVAGFAAAWPFDDIGAAAGRLAQPQLNERQPDLPQGASCRRGLFDAR